MSATAKTTAAPASVRKIQDRKDRQIRLHLVETQDGSGLYWTPCFAPGVPDLAAVVAIDALGHPPDTDGWIEAPETRGWYDPCVLGLIVFDLAAHSIWVQFCPGYPNRRRKVD